jgi:hypothetical protein
MKLIRTWTEVRKDMFGQPEEVLALEYSASFWEGPEAPGETGRRVTRTCRDIFHKGRFLNTSPSVSYYQQLLKAVS